MPQKDYIDKCLLQFEAIRKQERRKALDNFQALAGVITEYKASSREVRYAQFRSLHAQLKLCASTQYERRCLALAKEEALEGLDGTTGHYGRFLSHSALALFCTQQILCLRNDKPHVFTWTSYLARRLSVLIMHLEQTESMPRGARLYLAARNRLHKIFCDAPSDAIAKLMCSCDWDVRGLLELIHDMTKRESRELLWLLIGLLEAHSLASGVKPSCHQQEDFELAIGFTAAHVPRLRETAKNIGVLFPEGDVKRIMNRSDSRDLTDVVLLTRWNNIAEKTVSALISLFSRDYAASKTSMYAVRDAIQELCSEF